MDGLIVQRHNKGTIAMHWFHVVSVLLLIITGLRIYLGWGFPSTFAEARGLHMIAAILLFVASWILLPYSMFLEISEKSGNIGMKCTFRDFRGIWLYIVFYGKYCKNHGIKRFLRTSLFCKIDYGRFKGIVRHYTGKQEYPPFGVYNEKNGLYDNKIHPVMKLLIPFESTAALFIALTGIVLYDSNWTILSVNVGSGIMNIAENAGNVLGLNAMVLSRTVHLALSYFFIIELLIHVGILQMDIKTKEAWKAIFTNGKENISNSPYTIIKNK